MKEILETKALSLIKNGKQLLTEISLTFTQGEFNAILGPNGSGKSTLLRLLAGIWPPSSGRVTWKGIDLNTLTRKQLSRAITLVPQSAPITFNYLVEDVVAMGRYSYDPHYWNSIDSPLLAEALDAVDASHLRYRKVNELSYGERQRVYIARALMTESPIMLLDEPTAGLDIRHQIEIMNLLQDLITKGKIVIMTTHDLAIAERYSTQITLLKQGRCLGSGPLHDLMTEETIADLYDMGKISFKEAFRFQGAFS